MNCLSPKNLLTKTQAPNTNKYMRLRTILKNLCINSIWKQPTCKLLNVKDTGSYNRVYLDAGLAAFK